MRISKPTLTTITILILSSLSLFYFINANYKKNVNNAVQLSQAHRDLKNIDEIFYKTTTIELNSQRYLLTRDQAFKDKALQQLVALKQTAILIQNNPLFNMPENSVSKLLDKKIKIQESLLADISKTDGLLSSAGIVNKQISQILYQSLHELKEQAVNKVDLLQTENKAIGISNFKTTLVISLISLTLILLILLQIIKSRHLRKLAETDTREIEKKYKNLVEESGVGLLTTDLNGNITFINKRITAFTGFDCSEIIGKHFSSLVDTEYVQMINVEFKKHFQANNNEWSIEYPLKAKCGKTIWVQQSSVVITENGESKGFQCILKDITEKRRIDSELKQMEMEREENQFRLQSILDNTPLIIFMKDLEGRYLLANKSYREAFNLNKEEIIGKTDFDIVEQKDALRYHEVDQYIIKEQKNVEVEETMQKGDSTINLLIVKFPLFDKGNNLYGIGGIASDITERFLYGMHLIEAKKKAEMAEQLQEEFLANMSHEIRTPMNGIIGMTNILLSTKINEEQRDFLNVIKKSSDSLLILMNDILDLSKIKAGKLRIENIDFRLRETLEQTISTFRVLINEKRLTLRISVDLNVPDSLTGDPHRLNQILNNLLSNAIKFTTKGEINLEIKAISQDNNEVDLSFSVTDTGIGIPKEKLEYIFESFSQAETGTSRKFGGSGLGLSITKKLIELQNGSIDVKSEPEKGTAFTFSIKYKIAAHKVEKQFANKKQDSFVEEGLSGKRILVVEDNEANQKVIYHMLNKVGIETDLADNGKVAIQLLEDGFEYDLIIMDLQMPEMDGFETTIYIREKLKLKMPIVAMTASALRNEKIKCMELGMNEYLNKPFIPSELFRHLRRFLLKKEKPFSSNPLPASADNEPKKLYSLNHLIELDDLDCLCEVLQLFLDSTPVILNEIKEAIAEENWEEVYQKSHKLKSSIGILQMGKLMSLISKVETDSKERKNLEKIPENFEKAYELFSKINPMIQSELRNASELVLKN